MDGTDWLIPHCYNKWLKSWCDCPDWSWDRSWTVTDDISQEHKNRQDSRLRKAHCVCHSLPLGNTISNSALGALIFLYHTDFLYFCQSVSSLYLRTIILKELSMSAMTIAIITVFHWVFPCIMDWKFWVADRVAGS